MDEVKPGAGRSIDVLIADDHSVVRDGIRTVRERTEGEFRVVGETADVPSTIREVRELKPDLLTLDLTMPGRSSPGAPPPCFIPRPPPAGASPPMRAAPANARQPPPPRAHAP